MPIFQIFSDPPQKTQANEANVPKKLAIDSMADFQMISSQNASRDAQTNKRIEAVRIDARKADPGMYKPETQCQKFSSSSSYSREEGALALKMYNDLAGNEIYVSSVKRIYSELDKAGKFDKMSRKPSLDEFTKRFIVQKVAMVVQEKRNFSDSSEAKKINTLEVDKDANIRLCAAADIMVCMSFDFFGKYKDAGEALRKFGSGAKGQQSAYDSFFGKGSYKTMEGILDVLYTKWFGKEDEINSKRLSNARENLNMGFIAYVVQQDSAKQVDERNRDKNKTDFC